MAIAKDRLLCCERKRKRVWLLCTATSLHWRIAERTMRCEHAASERSWVSLASTRRTAMACQLASALRVNPLLLCSCTAAYDRRMRLCCAATNLSSLRRARSHSACNLSRKQPAALRCSFALLAVSAQAEVVRRKSAAAARFNCAFISAHASWHFNVKTRQLANMPRANMSLLCCSSIRDDARPRFWCTANDLSSCHAIRTTNDVACRLSAAALSCAAVAT